MSTSALILMTTYCSFATLMAGYFFYRVITSDKKNMDESSDLSDLEDKKSIKH